MHKYMTIAMPDTSIWAVPVEMIARHRAEYYANEFGGDVEKSLNKDTIPLFESDADEIEDWAVNNMNWGDFNGHQIKVSNPAPVDFQSGWIGGEKTFIDGIINISAENQNKFAEAILGEEGDFTELALAASRHKERKLQKETNS